MLTTDCGGLFACGSRSVGEQRFDPFELFNRSLLVVWFH